MGNEDWQCKQEIQSTQVANKILGSSESLYVGNLPKDTTEEQLMEIFSKYGKVVNVRVKKAPSPYCFIGFDTAAAVGRALKDQPIMVNGSHELKISEKKDKKKKKKPPGKKKKKKKKK